MFQIKSAISQIESVLKKCDDMRSDHSKDTILAGQLAISLKIFDEINLKGCDQEIKNRVARVITQTTRVVNSQLELSLEKADQIWDGLINLKNKLSEASPPKRTTALKKSKEIPPGLSPQPPKSGVPSKIEATLAYFCDTDHADWNGAIIQRVNDALQNPIPFITSLSLLNGSRISSESNYGSTRTVHQYLNDHAAEWDSEWDVYLHVEPGYEQEMVVFIPKQTLQGLSDREKLEYFDLKTDGSLQKISVAKAISGHHGKPSFEAFTHLFREDPKHTKLVYLSGHGGAGCPGGMSKEVFQKFLTFMEKQQCKGMAISSCYAGGETSLLFLPDQETLRKGVPFPVMAQSIGDFSTTRQEAEFSMKDRLEMMKILIEQPGGLTLKKWKKALSRLEEGKAKAISNQVQLYFPYAQKAPSGFRPAEEKPKTYSLTQFKLRKSIHEPDFDPILGLQLGSIDCFAVTPLVVDIPITFQRELPIFISQFPGTSHHYISHITIQEPIEGENLLASWLRKMHDFYGKPGISKAFFIDKFTTPKGSIENLVIYYSPFSTEFYYKINGEYFFHDGTNEKKISLLQYTLNTQQIITRTTSTRQAAMSGTAGQQNEGSFLEKIKSTYPFHKDAERVNIRRLRAMDQNDILDFEQWFNQLDSEDQHAVLFQISISAQENIMRPLIENNDISPNITDLNKISLLHYAIQCNSIRFIEFLITRGARVNDSGLLGYSALHYAAQRGSRVILEKLLTIPGIEKNCKDESGFTPVMMVRDPQLIPLLRQHGCDLDLTNTSGLTALGLAMEYRNYPMAQALLQAGANLNLGNPSPLFFAIISGDINPIKILLDAGAKGFEKDPNDINPFATCIERGTIEQIGVFLDHAHLASGHLNDPAKAYLAGLEKPLQFALRRGDQKIIFDLLEAGVDEYTPSLSVPYYLQQLAKNDPDLIRTILERKKEGDLTNDLFCSLVVVDPVLAEELLENDSINLVPSALRSKAFIINHVCEYGTLSLLKEVTKNWGLSLNDPSQPSLGDEYLTRSIRKKNREIFEYLLDQGAVWSNFDFPLVLSSIPKDLLELYHQKHPAVPQFQYTSLLHAALNQDPEIFKWLITTSGIDINALSPSSKKILPELIERKKFELAEFSLAHGLQLSESDRNDAYTAAIPSGQEAVNWLKSHGIEMAPEALQFDQKMSVLFFNPKSLEQIKFACSYGIDLTNSPDYDPSKYLSFTLRHGITTVLRLLIEEQNEEVFQLIRPSLEFLQTKGPEKIQKEITEFFNKWELL